MTKEESLIEFFGNIVRNDESIPTLNENPDGIVITIDDVEGWLDEYAVFRGDKKGLLEFIADCVAEEYERRLSYFKCEIEEARDFLSALLQQQFVSLNPTMHKSGSLFQTAADVFTEDYIIYKLDDEYFVFDNSEDSQFDYEFLIDGSDYKLWDFPEVIKVINEKLQKNV